MNEAGEEAGAGAGDPSGETTETPEFNLLDTAPDYAKDWDEVKNAKSPEDFWQWADNLRSFRGRAVALPGEDASDEQRMEVAQKLMERMPDLVMKPRNAEEAAALFKSLGMPEDPTGYNLDVEGFDPDSERFEAVRQAAHQANLTEDQFKAVFGAMAQMEAEASGERQSRVSESMSQLKTEWGAAYDQKIEGVRQFMNQMQLPQSWRDAEENGQFDATDYMAMDAMRQRMVGESAPGATNGGESGKLTPAEAQAKIDEIRGNREHPFNNPHAEPGARQRAIQEVMELYRMLPGGTQQVATAAFGDPL
jgi:hypothetical protein